MPRMSAKLISYQATVACSTSGEGVIHLANRIISFFYFKLVALLFVLL
jgi:hypothetical protein